MNPEPSACARNGPGHSWPYRVLLVGAAGVPASLLWDFSWESTIGVDTFWSPPHISTATAMGLAGLGAAALTTGSRSCRWDGSAIRLGKWVAPFGCWLVWWSVLAFATSLLFDFWWQSAYGLGAGIWHPPQLLKAASFFGAVWGVWLLAAAAHHGNPRMEGGGLLFAVCGGAVLALIHVVTLTSSYANQQHSASFYHTGSVYGLVLAALGGSGRGRWTATTGAHVYTGIFGVMVWGLPLFPAQPAVGPIYHSPGHLMPPPFPLLLVIPALGMDVVMRKTGWPTGGGNSWLQAGVLGLVFFFGFLGAQWPFALFLLSPEADNWFFAGGGKHWPFFLKVSEPARVMFWEMKSEQMTGRNTLIAVAWAIGSVWLGLWLGRWMRRVRR